MSRRLHKTLTDYVVIAISPALIMLLVGSLVHFLVELFYQGHYEARLLVVLSLFVFAAVLIARIAIEEGWERAVLFAVALGFVVLVALNQLIQYRTTLIASISLVIDALLMSITWWCAHKLTIDCTLIDDSEDASGEGVLQAAGLDVPDAEHKEVVSRQTAAAQTPQSAQPEPEGTTSHEYRPAPWWDRVLDPRPKAHAPGVWVVYFSVAALPIFGFGQWLIPTTDLARRQHVFRLLFVYVASGLGLLLTTSFLGLRRYLRQRRLEMPSLMANLWLGLGAAMIAVLLFVAALIPRPNAEYAISRLSFPAGSMLSDSATEKSTHEAPAGNSSGNDATPQQPPHDKPTQDQSSDSAADRSTSAAAAARRSADEPSSGKGSKGGQASNSPGARRDGRAGDQSGSQGKQVGGNSQPSSSSGAQRAANDMARKRSAAVAATRHSDSPAPQHQQQQQPTPAEQPPTSAPQPNVSPLAAPSLFALPFLDVFKWAFYVAAALTVLYALWRARDAMRAGWRDFLVGLRDFWNRLWGRRQSAASNPPPEIPMSRPFSSYVNPFATGQQASPEELIRYTFEAFEAWSCDNGWPRAPDETPHELANRASLAVASVEDGARLLADLYCRVAYARQRVPASSVAPLAQLWEQMRAAAPSEWLIVPR